jgi:hypothetical protein
MGYRLNPTGITSMRIAGLKFTVRLLIVVIVLFLGDAHAVKAQEPYFPELVFLPKNKELNSIIDDMTLVHLKAIADGDGIVIEAVKDGKYHVINRAGSATGESFKEFCRSLLELADEPAVLKAWNRFRDEEHTSPGYRPEPPQTEDQGDGCP